MIDCFTQSRDLAIVFTLYVTSEIVSIAIDRLAGSRIYGIITENIAKTCKEDFKISKDSEIPRDHCFLYEIRSELRTPRLFDQLY